MSYNIKDMVSNNRKAKFLYFRLNELWYETETGFKFPVPIEDTGDGIFNAEEKAILLMRYIRKHVKMLDDAEKEAASPQPVVEVEPVATTPVDFAAVSAFCAPEVSVVVTHEDYWAPLPTIPVITHSAEELIAKLVGTHLEGTVSIHQDAASFERKPYFRYDTEDLTSKDNWGTYCDLQEDLREWGWEIHDVYIEHDCVSGYLKQV